MIGTSDFRLAAPSLAKDPPFSDMAAERRIHVPLGQPGGPPPRSCGPETPLLPATSYPSLDGCGLDQSRIEALGRVAHAERVAVGKVFGNISIVSERNEWALFCEADMISLICKEVWVQTNTCLPAATDDRK
jgi:hypothetical protein